LSSSYTINAETFSPFFLVALEFELRASHLFHRNSTNPKFLKFLITYFNALLERIHPSHFSSGGAWGSKFNFITKHKNKLEHIKYKLKLNYMLLHLQPNKYFFPKVLSMFFSDMEIQEFCFQFMVR
jgi:hypothetical protein